jgi:hypothetical protein
MPAVERSFSSFQNAEVSCVLDLNSAYYQVPLMPRNGKFTAFCTPFGLLEFFRNSYGNKCWLPGIVQGGGFLFGDIKELYLYNFMDDLLVYSRTFEQHLKHLVEVFRRLETAGFVLNRRKVHLAQEEIKFWVILCLHKLSKGTI